jgi:hypothetical protein
LEGLFGFGLGGLWGGDEGGVEAVEFDGEAGDGVGEQGVPLEDGSSFDGGGVEVLNGGWGGAGGGVSGIGGCGGASGDVFDADAVDEEAGGVGGEGGGQGFGGGAGAGFDGQAEDGGAGGGCCGGQGFAAELGGEGAGEIEFVGGFGGGGPVEVDVVADALGGEVGDGLGKMEGGRPRGTGAGASNGKGGEERCERGGGEGRREMARPRGVAGGHPSQASILRVLAGDGVVSGLVGGINFKNVGVRESFDVA